MPRDSDGHTASEEAQGGLVLEAAETSIVGAGSRPPHDVADAPPLGWGCGRGHTTGGEIASIFHSTEESVHKCAWRAGVDGQVWSRSLLVSICR